MLDYGFSGTRETVLAEECRCIVSRLLQSESSATAKVESESMVPTAAQQRPRALAVLKAEFFQLALERDRNKAGLTLEGLLNRLFALVRRRNLSPILKIVGNNAEHLKSVEPF
jgi:hypothetical protein